MSLISGTTYEARWLVRDAWWLGFVWGVAAVILGALLVANPSPTSELFFAVLAGVFLTAGAAELVHAVVPWPHIDVRNLVRGTSSMLVAVLVLIHPLG